MTEESYEKFQDRLLKFILKLPDIDSLKDNKEQIKTTFQPFLNSISSPSEKERRIFIQTTKNIMISACRGLIQLKEEEINSKIYTAYQNAISQIRSNLDIERPKEEPEKREETRGRKRVPFHGKILKTILNDKYTHNLGKLLWAYYDDACPDKDYTKPREVYLSYSKLAKKLGVTTRHIFTLDKELIKRGHIMKELIPGKTSKTILCVDSLPIKVEKALKKSLKEFHKKRKPKEIEAQKKNLINQFEKLFKKADKGEIPNE